MACLLASALPLPAKTTLRGPVSANTLSKEQIRALGENEQVEFRGKITTKAQIKADLLRLKPQADAELRQKLAGSMAKFQRMSADLAAKQKAEIQSQKSRVMAEASRLLPGSGISGLDLDTVGLLNAPQLKNVGVLDVQPGDTLLASASYLGNQPGSVKLEGQFPGGALSLTVDSWKNTLLVATLPGGLTGVPHHTAYLSVTRPDGKTSNKIPVPFVATTEMKFLKSGDITAICSQAADVNDCDPVEGRTFDGVHINTIDFTPDTGTDKMRVKLKNGWVLREADAVKTSVFGSDQTLSPGFPFGQSEFDAKMNFSVAPISSLHFYVLFFVEGPVGLSYK